MHTVYAACTCIYRATGRPLTEQEVSLYCLKVGTLRISELPALRQLIMQAEAEVLFESSGSIEVLGLRDLPSLAVSGVCRWMCPHLPGLGGSLLRSCMECLGIP